MFSSNAAKRIASTALQAGQTAVNDIGMKAIDAGKTVAIDAGKRLGKMLLKNYPHPCRKLLLLWFHQKKLLKK